jgi:hypothetical protein
MRGARGRRCQATSGPLLWAPFSARSERRPHAPPPTNPPKSPVLEVVLSSLDRQLVVTPPPDPSAGGSGGADAPGQQGQKQQPPPPPPAPAAAAGLPPGGLAPAQAPPEEWAAAMRVLQGACVLHPKTRSVLATAQYLQVRQGGRRGWRRAGGAHASVAGGRRAGPPLLPSPRPAPLLRHRQLLVTRACACPPAAPPALDALLAISASSPEAQALFVGNGGLDRVVALACGRAGAPPPPRGGGGGTPGPAGSGSSGGGDVEVARDVRLRCLGFVHVFCLHVLAKAVRAGAAKGAAGPGKGALGHGGPTAEAVCSFLRVAGASAP